MDSEADSRENLDQRKEEIAKQLRKIEDITDLDEDVVEELNKKRKVRRSWSWNPHYCKQGKASQSNGCCVDPASVQHSSTLEADQATQQQALLQCEIRRM